MDVLNILTFIVSLSAGIYVVCIAWPPELTQVIQKFGRWLREGR